MPLTVALTKEDCAIYMQRTTLRQRIAYSIADESAGIYMSARAAAREFVKAMAEWADDWCAGPDDTDHDRDCD